MQPLTEDAKTILLRCAPLGGGDPLPLDVRAYNAVVRWLVERGLRPADLLTRQPPSALALACNLDEPRLTALLKRGLKLGFALEKWQQGGLWVVCRSDSTYPERYRTQLAEQAPPVLFGAGDPALLRGGGLAIVGSRNVDAEGATFAGNVAAWCARGSVPIVSGGARGGGEAAMASAQETGGVVLGVLADGLLRKSVQRQSRRALADGKLLLLSACAPEAGPDAVAARARNKLVYALADYALVVHAQHKTGGTWAGATEELSRKQGRPVFVRAGASAPLGNLKLLELGAIPFPVDAMTSAGSPAETLRMSLSANAADAMRQGELALP
jgi:predicted Rossmann fold nucleotide-binding protein DprA/Smf involved in DNA uptake